MACPDRIRGQHHIAVTSPQRRAAFGSHFDRRPALQFRETIYIAPIIGVADSKDRGAPVPSDGILTARDQGTRELAIGRILTAKVKEEHRQTRIQAVERNEWV